MLILAIDPGARETGIAVVEFDDRGTGGRGKLIASATVRSADTGTYLPVPDEYLAAVQYAVTSAVEAGVRVAAIEDTKPPNWHMGRAAYSPDALIATAQVAGWCRGYLSAAPLDRPPLMVPPHGNGAGPLGSYPSELVSATERRDPTWRVRVGGAKAKLRHERSAYDVARAGHRLYAAPPRPTLLR